MILPSVFIVPPRDINGPQSRDYTSRDTIFVSPSGNDGYMGYSENLSVKTLAKAKFLVNKMKKGDGKNIDVVFLRGKYTASEFFFKNNKLTFFKHDEGGDEDYSLTFKSHEKGTVIFDNSTVYKGFQSVGYLWKIKINRKDIRKCNMFGFVNGIRSVPARFPKYGNLSEYDIKTFNGISYIQVKDSSGFLDACVSYLSAGGSNSRLGYMRTQDFRFFTQSNITTITVAPSGVIPIPNIFYINIANHSYAGGFQFFANQSTILRTPPDSVIPDNSYEPSNLDPYSVCGVVGENTIIKEGEDYYFYYYPSSSDLLVGPNNSVLETYNVGATSQWLNSGNPRSNFSGVFAFANKQASGYSYPPPPAPDDTTVVGFNIISPKNVKFKDLDFRYCIAPLTLNNPSSAFSTGPADVNAFINEYTHGLTISGCKLYNTFGAGIMIRYVSDTLIYKNLIHSTEGAGIRYTGGYDTVIDNNIIKGSQQIDTRHNGDFGHSMGNIHVEGIYINNGHRSLALTGIKVSNNDLSYAGNNLKMDIGRELSACNNKVYNGGFGANSDMAALYSGFSSQTDTYNHFYRNLIYNSRARTNNNFLGNIMYFDGTTSNSKIYDNILANGQTGIQLTAATKTNVTNNIIYDMKVCGICNKSNGGTFPVSISIDKNIFVNAKSYPGIPSPRAFLGWNGKGVPVRPVYGRPYYATMVNTEGRVTATTRPINAWKSKIRYSSIATGGTGTVISPTILFDGNNWVIGDINSNDANDSYTRYRLSSINTAQYEYPWEVPDNQWVNLNTSNSTVFSSFSGVRRGDTRRNDSDGFALISDYNLFWSLMPTSDNPATDGIFFRYADALGGTMTFAKISSYADIPDPQRFDDNSVPSVFGNFNIIEQNSKIDNPLFYNASQFNFSVSPDSPALDLGFNDIMTDDIGVYNTTDDPYWRLSASNLKAQPVINGHKDWSDYNTIPFPYTKLVEYGAVQHDQYETIGDNDEILEETSNEEMGDEEILEETSNEEMGDEEISEEIPRRDEENNQLGDEEIFDIDE